MHVESPFQIKQSRIESYVMRLWRCEHCGSTRGVAQESGRSMYVYDGEEGSIDDPNRAVGLCRECAHEWHDYWDEMWRMVQNSY